MAENNIGYKKAKEIAKSTKEETLVVKFFDIIRKIQEKTLTG